MKGLIRITEFNGRIAALDADGLISVWQKDKEGDVYMFGDCWSFMHEIRPSELFEILNRNSKRLV